MEELHSIPKHVGIIMDGNGRWAKMRGKPRNFGHNKGAKIVKDVALDIFNFGVDYLSLYAFSTENMNRPKEEVDKLFDILEKGIVKYGELAFKKHIRLVISGDTTVLNDSIQEKIDIYTKKTAIFDKPVLNLLINYGGKQEICRAVNLALDKGQEITPLSISENLYNNIPPLDLVIRSGGEQRLSNFMLWHASYAELYFTDVLWPDFNKEEVEKALTWFSERKRRFGKL